MKNAILPGAGASLFSPEEQEAVRRQLAHITASPLFRNSKRFPDFLRYTVEEALSGNYEQLKERMLGVEVFGRDAAYDTNSDPVVRMTAVEVRKRLAQYYQMAGHEAELRIEFPRGSYVPEFKFPQAAPTPPAPEQKAIPASVEKPGRKRYWAAALVLAALTIAILAWRGHSPASERPFDHFWAPIISSNSPVLICIPDLISTATPSFPGSQASVSSAALAAMPDSFKRNRVTFGDSFAASMLANVLGRENRSFRLRRADEANLQDLEEGPVVLIGGRTANQWSLKLDDELRFGAVHQGTLHYVGDRENPLSRQWSVTRTPGQTEASMTNDYAIISRVYDPTTGHQLLTAAGLFQYGTEAAGMCLSSPSCLADAEKLAPGDWQHKNIQIVIQTTIISENAGEPRVLAAYLW
ncbi:MAG TPA: hypothetical protein VMB47_15780 [Candidatus Aquilonibacter sp.]|nr:hypothetical protein [Candidatus Aquilonibacter sp.]